MTKKKEKAFQRLINQNKIHKLINSCEKYQEKADIIFDLAMNQKTQNFYMYSILKQAEFFPNKINLIFDYWKFNSITMLEYIRKFPGREGEIIQNALNSNKNYNITENIIPILKRYNNLTSKILEILAPYILGNINEL